ncbi:hypothetical protein HDV00_004854, partial [Rhizophlyctis rosea]
MKHEFLKIEKAWERRLKKEVKEVREMERGKHRMEINELVDYIRETRETRKSVPKKTVAVNRTEIVSSAEV